MSAARQALLDPALRGRVGAVHVHTAYSHDGRDTLEQLAEWARERGIAFVGLTDHAEDLDAGMWEEYVAHCADVSDDRTRLIPGLEFRFKGYTGLHLLAFGLTRWIEPTTPGEFAAMTRTAARFTAVAHPVLAKWRVPDEVRAVVDAVEVWNASYNTRYLPDPRAIALLREIRATRPAVVAIAGLDQHDSSNDRETRVLLDRASDAPLGELRAARFRNTGRTMGFDAHAELGAMGSTALRVARTLFDGIERTQERVSRALQGRPVAHR